MKEYGKEIIICIIALTVAGVAIWLFSRSLQSEKEVNRTDLYELIPSEPVAILRINRGDVFNNTLEQVPELYESLKENIPEIYFSIIRQHPKLQQIQISFHPLGTLFAANVTGKESKQLTKETLPALLPFYTPVIHKKYGMELSFLAGEDGSFFGYFETESGWVGSYNRKLLEEALRQYLTGKSNPGVPATAIRNILNPSEPVNLLIKKGILGFPEKSNTGVYDEIPWIGADLFISENLCLFTSFSPSFAPAWSPDSIAFAFTEKISLFLPSLPLSYQLEAENENFYYTVCGAFSKEVPVQDHHTQNEQPEEVSGQDLHEDQSGDSYE